jgi:hypothetical protein
MQRQIAYVVDALPSPPDSQEWPTLYIRGCKELPTKVEEIIQSTAGNLGYVGEWHSHPEGAATSPSGDDRKVFAWLTERMDAEGKPAMMMIVGDNEIRLFLCEMSDPKTFS